ncbi:MAG: hypothetical protein LBM23_07815 [Propionibacteriaceae bacterium]|jgi:hypothetical protein|nr:hypothetical protein [Propionibacteriaceae bacterium]
MSIVAMTQFNPAAAAPSLYDLLAPAVGDEIDLPIERDRSLARAADLTETRPSSREAPETSKCSEPPSSTLRRPNR